MTNAAQKGVRWAADLLARTGRSTRSAVASISSRIGKVPPPRPVQLPPLPPPEPGRTQNAEKPHLLSLRGWGEVALVIWDQIALTRLFLVAAGVAFYVMLSIVPSITALVWVFGLFANPADIARHLDDVAFLLPKDALSIIRAQVDAIAGGTSRFTPVVAITMLIAFWSANAGMKAMIDAMNLIYGVDEKRNFFVLNLHSMLFTLGALLIFLLTINLLVVAPLVLAFADLDIYFHRLLAYVRWPSLLAITILFLTMLNRYGPSRHYSKARWPVWGSTLGAFMWLGVSLAFSFYVERIGNLTATYGSLAAIIGLMLWLWLSALVVLIGIELNAELERRTARWEAEQLRASQPVPEVQGIGGALGRMAGRMAGRLAGRFRKAGADGQGGAKPD